MESVYAVIIGGINLLGLARKVYDRVSIKKVKASRESR